MNQQQTEISKIGEFGLIDRLTDGISLVNKSSLRGVGDDCAVLRYPDMFLYQPTSLSKGFTSI